MKLARLFLVLTVILAAFAPLSVVHAQTGTRPIVFSDTNLTNTHRVTDRGQYEFFLTMENTTSETYEYVASLELNELPECAVIQGFVSGEIGTGDNASKTLRFQYSTTCMQAGTYHVRYTIYFNQGNQCLQIQEVFITLQINGPRISYYTSGSQIRPSDEQGIFSIHIGSYGTEPVTIDTWVQTNMHAPITFLTPSFGVIPVDEQLHLSFSVSTANLPAGLYPLIWAIDMYDAEGVYVSTQKVDLLLIIDPRQYSTFLPVVLN